MKYEVAVNFVKFRLKCRVYRCEPQWGFYGKLFFPPPKPYNFMHKQVAKYRGS